MTSQIILSTDPGIDDAMALIFLEKLGTLEVVWTTFGNNSLENCTNNALRLLKLIGKYDIPVIKGVAEPIVRRFCGDAKVHGYDGLGNTNLTLPDRAQFTWQSRTDLIERLQGNPEQYDLVSIGPLTNLAMLFDSLSSDVASLIKNIIVMGGSITIPGNVTPYAEFNIFCDPHAAKRVLESGIPITLVGLDVTQQVILTQDHINEIQKENTVIAKFIADIANFYSRFHMGINGCYLHDPLAAAVALDPMLIKTEKMNIEVICDNNPKLGQTLVSSRKNSPKIKVAVKVNVERFLRYFIDTILL